jgi:hypothetical protein
MSGLCRQVKRMAFDAHLVQLDAINPNELQCLVDQYEKGKYELERGLIVLFKLIN